jgi:hypothetical protein
MPLAAVVWLQVTQSLVQHLNTNMKVAIDKADDAEADSVQAKQQVRLRNTAQHAHCCYRVLNWEQGSCCNLNLLPGHCVRKWPLFLCCLDCSLLCTCGPVLHATGDFALLGSSWLRHLT